jgi:replicative DNA helicase
MKTNDFFPNELPNNLFAEQALINIIFFHPSLMKNLSFNIKSEMFYKYSHQMIYQTIYELFEKDYSINIINLLSSFQEKGILEKIGGIQEIGNILNQNQNPYDLNLYLQIFNETYLRRRLIQFGKDVISSGFNISENLDQLFEEIERKIFFFNQQKLTEKISSASEIIDDVFSEIKLKIAKNEKTGFQTSFKDLDAILQGLQKSDLIVIAGRPSMGKTAFSLNIGKNIVETYNIPLIIFSLEMSKQQIIYRFLSTESSINSNRLKSGKMTQLEWKKLTDCMNKLSEFPIFIDDNPSITVAEIRAKLKKLLLKTKNEIIVIIDYLQLMKISSKLENRSQEISYITRNLKILAREFQIPIILLSQLSRNVESRTNKRPLLSDLRESGCKSLVESSYQTSFQIWNKFSCYTHFKPTFLNKGLKPIFLITLDNQQSFLITSNHKILSKKGWISIDQFQKDENIFNCRKKTTSKKLEIGFNTIKTIQYKGLSNVYDRMIPIFHNYIENGVIFHNSIEQDADIVIMIYREEYYNEKSSKPQITEFIVAKHRNGSLGTVKLLFNPIITSYQNL